MTRSFLQVFFAIVVVSIVRLPRSSGAIISVDTVLGPDHPYPNQTITVVDGMDPPTEVTILEGTHVGSPPSGPGLDIYGQSIVTLLNGGVLGAPAVLLHDKSVFHMVDGSILGGIEARDSSQVIIADGFWGNLFASGTSRVRIDNSPLGNPFPAEFSGQSHAVISGGDVFLSADEQSTVLLKGGFFRYAIASGDSKWLVSGGFFDEDGFRVDSGVVDVRGLGGSDFGIKPLLVRGGTVHFYGTGLHFESQGGVDKVVGVLADGDPIDARYQLSPAGQIILHEVPEPGTLAMMGVGVAMLAVGRFRRFVLRKIGL